MSNEYRIRDTFSFDEPLPFLDKGSFTAIDGLHSMPKEDCYLCMQHVEGTDVHPPDAQGWRIRYWDKEAGVVTDYYGNGTPVSNYSRYIILPA